MQGRGTTRRVVEGATAQPALTRCPSTASRSPSPFRGGMRGEPMTIRPRRSALYMPASNLRAIDKARSLPCDVVIFDLEDAVAPEAKAEARANAVAAVRDGGFGKRELVIRVNALGTPWAEDDLAAAASSGADAILAPKVGDADSVRRYHAAIAAAPAATGFWAMVETTRAIFRLDAIAEAMSARPAAFVLGTNDLAKEMGARLTVERTPFLGMMAMAVAAAKGHGLAILDGVYNAFDDEAGLDRQCAEAKAYGFDGKTLIHPRQIDPTNRAFSPDAAEIAWARAAVDGFAAPENAGKGAIRVGGEMVERLHLDQAHAILAMAGDA
ncbi:Citryl-CoA lyase [Rhizorhabdus wittichii RW1]|uniref:Citryl-CoA lyase n=1 Tax=Rhizorhabdus wittichii (strain DSM 6014 / CCUG 31198 / JCM 15750 / NBRC 105917 / EY 4224 / RW1) TaxID=392499 RepID=A0A9J9HCR1_RHIWR|nr:Citryl-CoA lyase [Rhizorhabdus wittichii RW1]